MAYRRLVTGLLIFTLFNSSDVFLLLKAKQNGFSDTAVIGVYIFYNLVYAVFSLPLGKLADKIGLKKIFYFGIALFGVVYLLMGLTSDLRIFIGLFFLYGIYAAATEGISKAWVSNISDKKDVGTAIGTFTGLQSIFTMLASSLAGLIWFANSTGIMRNTKDVQENLNVKIVCPRCEGEPGRKENCALCRGTGYLWVDKTKYLPGEIESVE